MNSFASGNDTSTSSTNKQTPPSTDRLKESDGGQHYCQFQVEDQDQLRRNVVERKKEVDSAEKIPKLSTRK